MFHLKSKVFNNVESPLKAQSGIQALRWPTMVGKLKGQLVLNSECSGFGKLYLRLHVCVYVYVSERLLRKCSHRYSMCVRAYQFMHV